VYNTLRDDYKNESDQAELLNVEFNEFLLNSFTSRLELVDFSSVEFPTEFNNIYKDDIYSIYQSIKFYKYNLSTSKNRAYEGDLYQKANDDDNLESNNFYINISAPCELRHKMLLIKGELVNDSTKSKSKFDLPIFMGKNAMRFSFREICYMDNQNDYSEIEINDDGTYKRIGRITHPYITAIRGEYAHFISRQGYTRHPESKKLDKIITQQNANLLNV
jgi:hypothetical protein